MKFWKAIKALEVRKRVKSLFKIQKYMYYNETTGEVIILDYYCEHFDDITVYNTYYHLDKTLHYIGEFSYG